MSRSVVSNSAAPWTVAGQTPLSMEFSRQEYWRGRPFPSPGDLPNREVEPGSSSLQAESLPSEPPGKPKEHVPNSQKRSLTFHSPSFPGSTLSVYSSFPEEAMDPATSRKKTPPLPSKP